MSEITRLLAALPQNPEAALAQLFPLVYDELRVLARSKLAAERPGQTLEPTALVHEAYLRLVGNAAAMPNERRYFFAAAAEAMRRILIEAARSRLTQKRGGDHDRQFLDLIELPEAEKLAEMVDIHETLDRLASVDPDAAELVKLRYFAGLSMDEIAEVLGVSRRQAQYTWAFARSWLFQALHR